MRSRKPKGYAVDQPGDRVQVDTLDVRPCPPSCSKHFTARDVVLPLGRASGGDAGHGNERDTLLGCASCSSQTRCLQPGGRGGPADAAVRTAAIIAP